MQSALKYFGASVSLSILGDASAALGVIRRHGLGRPRHIDTSFLWVQEPWAHKAIAYGTLAGADNPADGQNTC